MVQLLKLRVLQFVMKAMFMFLVLLICNNILASAGGCSYNESWFENMPVDHFSFENSDTFRLRYLINTENWNSDGGPIFFYCGNEGSVEGFAENTGFMWENAKDFGAMVVFAEHRYYGKSLPFGNESSSNLGKLNSEQAMADYAVLINWLKTNITGAKNSAVIAFGGSYGGMLAAWMRTKYPHLVDGAIAASAPVAQFSGMTVCSSFSDITTEVYRNASPSCALSIKRSWPIIPEGRLDLAKMFRLCNETQFTSKKNVTQLVNWLTDIYGTLAMVNYPYATEFLKPVPAWPVACQFLNDTEVGETELLHRIYSTISIYTNFTGKKPCNLLENDYGDSVDGKLWDYQACTEMVMPMCNTKDSMFEQSDWNLTEFSDECFEKFKVRPRPDWAIINYGGRKLESATNVVFSNGWLDPWRGGGIVNSHFRGVAALIVEDGAHHYDLRGSNSADTASVQTVRLLELGFIRKWIKNSSLRQNRPFYYTKGNAEQMNRNCPPGWNDPPPTIPISSNLTKFGSARELLRQRVVHPIEHAYPSSCASNSSTFNTEPSSSSELNRLPPMVSNKSTVPTTIFSHDDDPSGDVDIYTQQQQNSVEFTDEELLSKLSICLEKCSNIPSLSRENIIKRIQLLKEALEMSISSDCRMKLNQLVDYLSNERYKKAYELHSAMMLYHFEEVHTWMVGVKALILECLKEKHKNIVDQYKFWQVVKSPGSSKSKQFGKRKIHHTVRLRHINTLKAQLDAEYEVMKCLASPYLSKEEEEAWHLEYGTTDQQRANCGCFLNLTMYWFNYFHRKASSSSKQWIARHLRDPYVVRCRSENYRCRSAFKLLEIDDRFQILKPGMLVLDLGSSPGSWSQVLSRRVNSVKLGSKPFGKVFAVDRQPMEPLDGVTWLGPLDLSVGDSVNVLLQRRRSLTDGGEPLDAVVSDMAPNATGCASVDHERIVQLGFLSLSIAIRCLKLADRSFFLCKLWQGVEQWHFADEIKRHFGNFKIVKPTASRKESAELYFLARQFKG
ncbi:Lysosomal Pro-X carboxypeptidase [Trichinella nelsoni]|uniref:Lysosomal Pro-X carboxypeptidase n=1 Tax=Trichinella nelsoni TaxID=6336 RepID=A0A0V0S6H1_9BILA|nr:Lysosomal Pro-X carboxypeptidase [Trichinella nelsoni]